MSSVIILFGGPSSERRVSLASAQHLALLLPEAKLWFWAKDGAVHAITPHLLRDFVRPFEHDFDPGCEPTYPSVPRALDHAHREDTFFLALHGEGGEDGTVQRWLEERRLYFTGSSAAASRRAFDKAESKSLVAAAGIAIAPARVVRGAAQAEALASIMELLSVHGRVVLKPVADGSSTGLSFVEKESEARAAVMSLATTPEVPFLAEAFIDGTELTVSVIDAEGGPRALPCAEIRCERGARFDYEGKYLGHGVQEIIPAEVGEELCARAGALAVLAHLTLGCTGYSRTDIIAGPHDLVFLELNNLPGLTRASFLPKQLMAAGIDMQAFIARQIALARARYNKT